MWCILSTVKQWNVAYISFCITNCCVQSTVQRVTKTTQSFFVLYCLIIRKCKLILDFMQICTLDVKTHLCHVRSPLYLVPCLFFWKSVTKYENLQYRHLYLLSSYLIYHYLCRIFLSFPIYLSLNVFRQWTYVQCWWPELTLDCLLTFLWSQCVQLGRHDYLPK